MACSLSSRICSTLASIAPSACAVAVLTASADCAATVLADSRRSVAFSADCLFVVLMMGFSLGSMWGFGGCAAVTVRCNGEGFGPRAGPADHGSRTSAHLGVLFLHRTTAAAVAGVSQRRDHPAYIGIPGGAGAAVRHAHKGQQLVRRLGVGLRHARAAERTTERPPRADPSPRRAPAPRPR